MSTNLKSGAEFPYLKVCGILQNLGLVPQSADAVATILQCCVRPEFVDFTCDYLNHAQKHQRLILAQAETIRRLNAVNNRVAAQEAPAQVPPLTKGDWNKLSLSEKSKVYETDPETCQKFYENPPKTA